MLFPPSAERLVQCGLLDGSLLSGSFFPQIISFGWDLILHVLLIRVLLQSITILCSLAWKVLPERLEVSSGARLICRFVCLLSRNSAGRCSLPVCVNLWFNNLVFLSFFLLGFAIFLGAIRAIELLLLGGIQRYLFRRDAHASEMEPLGASITHDHRGLIFTAANAIDSIWWILLGKTGIFIGNSSFLNGCCCFKKLGFRLRIFLARYVILLCISLNLGGWVTDHY